MNFAIVNNFDIIERIASEDEFVEYVCNIHPNAKFVEFINIDDITNDNNFKSGKYLLKINNIIKLVCKEHIKDVGYIYDGVLTSIDIVDQWELFNYNVRDVLVCIKPQKVVIIPPKKFDMMNMNDCPNILHIGKRGSFINEQTMKIIKHYITHCSIMENDIYVFSYLDHEINGWKKKFPKVHAHVLTYGCIENAEKIINAIETTNIQKKSNKKILISPSDIFTKKNNLLMELTCGYRGKNIITILSSQFPAGISPEIRAQFHYVFLHAGAFVNSLKRSYEHYAGFFPNFQNFREHMKEYTKNEKSMVICNAKYNAKSCDKIFTFQH